MCSWEPSRLWRRARAGGARVVDGALQGDMTTGGKEEAVLKTWRAGGSQENS